MTAPIVALTSKCCCVGVEISLQPCKDEQLGNAQVWDMPRSIHDGVCAGYPNVQTPDIKYVSNTASMSLCTVSVHPKSYTITSVPSTAFWKIANKYWIFLSTNNTFAESHSLKYKILT